MPVVHVHVESLGSIAEYNHCLCKCRKVVADGCEEEGLPPLRREWVDGYHGKGRKKSEVVLPTHKRDHRPTNCTDNAVKMQGRAGDWDRSAPVNSPGNVAILLMRIVLAVGKSVPPEGGGTPRGVKIEREGLRPPEKEVNLCAADKVPGSSALNDDVALADAIGTACLGLEFAHENLVSL
jgi:hypothetical protein